MFTERLSDVAWEGALVSQGSISCLHACLPASVRLGQLILPAGRSFIGTVFQYTALIPVRLSRCWNVLATPGVMFDDERCCA